MLARAYDRRVEIWGSTEIDDGSGGFVLSNSLIVKRWANIDTKVSIRSTEIGKVENFYSTIFKFRGINDFMLSEKNNFILYRGYKYIINKIEDINLNSVEIVVYCTALKQIETEKITSWASQNIYFANPNITFT